MQANDILFLIAQITSLLATGTVVFVVLSAVKSLIFWILGHLGYGLQLHGASEE